MSHANARASIEQGSIDGGWDVDCDMDWDVEDETSGVFAVQRWPAADVAVGALRDFDPEGEPLPVYAVPYVLLGRNRVRTMRDYYLGTRFATGLICAEGWEDEMRSDGVPEFMIAKCRTHVARLAV